MSSIKRVERELAVKLGAKPDDAATLNRLARLFAANPNHPRYSGKPATTATGRALSPGRVTRKSNEVRQRAKGELGAPLPIGMGAHHKRLTPTPRNPDCLTRMMRPGDVVVLALTYTERNDYIAGRGLSPCKARYSIVSLNDITIGYASDPQYAIAWTVAAKTHGFTAHVVDNGSK